jgi:prolyl-tRNA synthetase
MRYSQTVFKTLRQAPKDVETVNHKLLVQAGFVRQLMAGVYTYLPLGHRVLDKISNIVREEMDAIGSEEVLMPMLHPAENWKKTGGWESIDVLFKLQSRTKKDYALSQSHEEVVTPLAKEFIRELPLSIYHIQWKFRDELRSKSGIMRGREFLMKDMYSWHLNQEDFEKYYAKAKQAYLNVFKRLGLEAKVTEASGGAFSEKVSYEFEVLCAAGEANIMYCQTCDYCVNTDDLKTDDNCPRCKGSKMQRSKAAEVGNVFDLGQKYSKAFDLKIDGVYPTMGCYGIGISRTMGVIVEKFHDAKGIVWPKEIAPFDVHLVGLNNWGDEVYKKLMDSGVEVLFDDTDKSAGEKFANADLIGIPVRLVVSDKTQGKVEWKDRNSGKVELLELEKVIKKLV